VAEKQPETHFLRKDEQQKWIVDHVESETAGARKRVEDPGAAVQDEQEDINNADNA
jgi:hypothetical protein